MRPDLSAVAASDIWTFLEKLRHDELAVDFFRARERLSDVADHAVATDWHDKLSCVTMPTAGYPGAFRDKATKGRKERVAEIRSVRLPPTSGGIVPLAVQVVRIGESKPPGVARPGSRDRRFVRRRRNAGLVRIENWHRAPKSGREVKETGGRTAARLERVINAACCIMTLLARKTPNDPAEFPFLNMELPRATRRKCGERRSPRRSMAQCRPSPS